MAGGLDFLIRSLVSGHEAEWIAALAGAGGALAGAIVTVAWTEAFNRRTRREDDKRRRRAVALSVWLKLNQIYSWGLALRNHLATGLAHAQAMEADHACRVVLPILGPVSQLTITVDELQAAGEFGGLPLLNMLSSLDLAYNQTSDGMARYYRDRRGALSYGHIESWEAGISTTAASDDEYNQARPLLLELDSLLTQTLEHSAELAQRTFCALAMLAYARGRPLGADFSISLPDLDGKPTTLSAADAPRLWDWFAWMPYPTGRELPPLYDLKTDSIILPTAPAE